jgi:hypothetical protein
MVLLFIRFYVNSAAKLRLSAQKGRNILTEKYGILSNEKEKMPRKRPDFKETPLYLHTK